VRYRERRRKQHARPAGHGEGLLLVLAVDVHVALEIGQTSDRAAKWVPDSERARRAGRVDLHFTTGVGRRGSVGDVARVPDDATLDCLGTIESDLLVKCLRHCVAGIAEVVRGRDNGNAQARRGFQLLHRRKESAHL
jgi:hypothetical protein